MHKAFYYLLFSIFLFSKSYGQVTPSDKHLMDSLLQNDEFLKMINEVNNTKSYFRINLGIGNRLFSGKNKAVENIQTNNQLVVIPSVGYFHKSGLGISFTGFLSSENNSTGFHQYALSPSYLYNKSNAADLSVSYNHYFKENLYNSSTFPINNEIYASILFKKPWIKPGLSASYSLGKYIEIVNIDTTVIIQNRSLHIKFIDTATTKISSFSMIGSIEHDFNFYGFFTKNDGLRFTPQISVITGMNNYSVSYKSSSQFNNSYTKNKLKRLRRFQSSSDNNKTKYEIQSLGLDLDLNYSIGKFYIEPELYLDYYLPKTDYKSFTQIFNINIGLTF